VKPNIEAIAFKRNKVMFFYHIFLYSAISPSKCIKVTMYINVYISTAVRGFSIKKTLMQILWKNKICL
jgi:hypothetical protein